MVTCVIRVDKSECVEYSGMGNPSASPSFDRSIQYNGAMGPSEFLRKLQPIACRSDIPVGRTRSTVFGPVLTKELIDTSPILKIDY